MGEVFDFLFCNVETRNIYSHMLQGLTAAAFGECLMTYLSEKTNRVANPRHCKLFGGLLVAGSIIMVESYQADIGALLTIPEMIEFQQEAMINPGMYMNLVKDIATPSIISLLYLGREKIISGLSKADDYLTDGYNTLRDIVSQKTLDVEETQSPSRVHIQKRSLKDVIALPGLSKAFMLSNGCIVPYAGSEAQGYMLRHWKPSENGLIITKSKVKPRRIPYFEPIEEPEPVEVVNEQDTVLEIFNVPEVQEPELSYNKTRKSGRVRETGKALVPVSSKSPSTA